MRLYGLRLTPQGFFFYENQEISGPYDILCKKIHSAYSVYIIIDTCSKTIRFISANRKYI